jgi:ABC-type multidrug transport system fused ATPase/permease subunit
MESKTNTNHIIRSALTGIVFTAIFLLLGLVLDYALTQILSQYFIPDCSEDCYFKYFNAIFIVAAILSVAGGVMAGFRAYRRLSKNQ